MSSAAPGSSESDDYVYENRIRYDYPDGRVEWSVERPASSGAVRTVLLAGLGCVAVGAAVGGAVGLRLAAGKGVSTVQLPSNGFALAAKALVYGTVLAWGTAGVATFAVAKMMGVNSVREFADVMRAKIPYATNAVRNALKRTPEQQKKD